LATLNYHLLCCKIGFQTMDPMNYSIIFTNNRTVSFLEIINKFKKIWRKTNNFTALDVWQITKWFGFYWWTRKSKLINTIYKIKILKNKKRKNLYTGEFYYGYYFEKCLSFLYLPLFCIIFVLFKMKRNFVYCFNYQITITIILFQKNCLYLFW
jgi:hypothetical protein